MKRLLLFLALCGCDNMEDQPRYEPYEASTFFADGRSSRTPVAGTVARGQLDREAVGEKMPRPTMVMLERGRERYDIYCSPCHDKLGTGRGIIVERGFQQPPTLHQDRLRLAADTHLYQVITRGQGAMYAYGSRIPPSDRWAIVAYVRALQLSQNVRREDLPPDVLTRLESE